MLSHLPLVLLQALVAAHTRPLLLNQQGLILLRETLQVSHHRLHLTLQYEYVLPQLVYFTLNHRNGTSVSRLNLTSSNFSQKSLTNPMKMSWDTFSSILNQISRRTELRSFMSSTLSRLSAFSNFLMDPERLNPSFSLSLRSLMEVTIPAGSFCSLLSFSSLMSLSWLVSLTCGKREFGLLQSVFFCMSSCLAISSLLSSMRCTSFSSSRFMISPFTFSCFTPSRVIGFYFIFRAVCRDFYSNCSNRWNLSASRQRKDAYPLPSRSSSIALLNSSYLRPSYSNIFLSVSFSLAALSSTISVTISISFSLRTYCSESFGSLFIFSFSDSLNACPAVKLAFDASLFSCPPWPPFPP